jgi:hypothetical protein
MQQPSLPHITTRGIRTQQKRFQSEKRIRPMFSPMF